ncbi:MAG: CAP domain-containing protein, partial [Acidimicrobiales bacterium]
TNPPARRQSAATTAPPAPAPAPAPASSAAASSNPSGAEGRFFALLNAERERQGLAPFGVDAALTEAARAQAQKMASENRLHHQGLRPLLGRFRIVGENVGAGPTIDTINQALLRSPPHHENIANPAFTAVGVGVAVDATGQIWTSHVFGG